MPYDEVSNQHFIEKQMANKPSNIKHKLLDYVIDMQCLANDANLARYIGVTPSVVSNMRSGRLSFGPKYILRLHEQTGWPVEKIKELLS